jgi:hypothetical protein
MYIGLFIDELRYRNKTNNELLNKNRVLID